MLNWGLHEKSVITSSPVLRKLTLVWLGHVRHDHLGTFELLNTYLRLAREIPAYCSGVCENRAKRVRYKQAECAYAKSIKLKLSKFGLYFSRPDCAGAHACFVCIWLITGFHLATEYTFSESSCDNLIFTSLFNKTPVLRKLTLVRLGHVRHDHLGTFELLNTYLRLAREIPAYCSGVCENRAKRVRYKQAECAYAKSIKLKISKFGLYFSRPDCAGAHACFVCIWLITGFHLATEYTFSESSCDNLIFTSLFNKTLSDL